MKFLKLLAVFMLLLGLLLNAGCGNTEPATSTQPSEPDATEAATETSDPVASEDPTVSLNNLRQSMVETPQLFAVAYFGYQDAENGQTPVDPYTVMAKQTPKLCEDLPFLAQIPADQIIGAGGDLFCIVPLDEDATVAVSRGYWDDENEQYIYDDMVYSSSTGDPILLFCNNSGDEPDTQVYISGPSGEVFWYPQTDDNGCAMALQNDNWEDLFLDFSSYRELLAARYRNLKDMGWDLPTEEQLIGITWNWYGYLKDGRQTKCSVVFEEDILSVQWNDGFDEMDHEYLYAPWELTNNGEFAVLTIDFGEFAGILRYDLLHHSEYEELYVGMDVVQEEMNIGWEPLFRFLDRSIAPEPVEMIGTWEQAWTEVEGYRMESEPGACIIEIRTAASAGLLMSYISEDSPEQNFDNELMTIDMRQMHMLCGNDEWVADLDYVGPWDTTYAVTLTADGILIKQNYFLLDGAPSVSYEYFRRAE